MKTAEEQEVYNEMVETFTEDGYPEGWDQESAFAFMQADCILYDLSIRDLWESIKKNCAEDE